MFQTRNEAKQGSRGILIGARFSDKEHTRIERACKKLKLSMSDLLRVALREKLEKEHL